MTVLIDTNVFIWYDNNDARLSATASKIIEARSNIVYISAASIWEMAILISNGDLSFYSSLDKVVRQITSRYKFKVLPILNKHSVFVSTMSFPSPKHKNPFDRLIIAQSIVEDIPLVASDAFFGQYKDLKLIW